jgi:putative effector of murein hydrolase LrgA (UPF0299 family)
MADVRSPIKLALLGAIPIEALNLIFFAFPLGTGLPANIPWYTRLMADQWLLLHLPGVVSLGLLGRLALQRFDYFVLFVSGYLETVLLLIACVVFCQWIREVSRRRFASSDRSAISGD